MIFSANRTKEGDYTEEQRISDLCDSIEELRISPLNSKMQFPVIQITLMSTGQQFKLIALNQALISYLLVLFFIIKFKKRNNYFKIKISLFNISVTKYNGIKSISLS